ncbi:MAG: hypothetical protein SVR04_12340 [Spirochaetota bacterium]|nr:hypothetical protein [Spirochaetota bacterium]
MCIDQPRQHNHSGGVNNPICCPFGGSVGFSAGSGVTGNFRPGVTGQPGSSADKLDPVALYPDDGVTEDPALSVHRNNGCILNKDSMNLDDRLP